MTAIIAGQRAFIIFTSVIKKLTESFIIKEVARSAKFIALIFTLMILPLGSFSQYGPMGIGNGDGSATSAGPQPKLILWLDGSSAEPYINNAPVSQWTDKSGNGHHFLPTGIYNPVLRTGGPPFGGPRGAFPGSPNRPCVRFANLDDQMECANFELTGNGYTIYFIVESSDNNYGLITYSTATSGQEMSIYNDNGIRQQMLSSIDRSSAVGDISTGNWNYGGILLATSDGYNWEYNRTNHYEGGYSAFNGINFAANGSAMIGDIPNPTDTYPSADEFTGGIAEIIIYEGRLNRPATRLMRTYFWLKYGLSGASSGWDKMNNSNSAGSEFGGRCYTPIGIGRDSENPNAGSINEARSEGLVLRVNSTEWTQTRTYLCAAVQGGAVTGPTPNTVVTQGLASLPTVINRWSRLWEINGADNTNQIYQVGFDFGEGINGDVPQNPENFVLLYRDNPTSGDFSVLPVSNSNKFILDDEIVFRVSRSQLTTPNRYYTVGTTDASSSLTGQIQRTWYAYQSGDWSDPLTWTLDGSSAPVYVNPGNSVPNVFDNVYIDAGRTVDLDMTLPQHGTLTVIGTLDMGSADQPNFAEIRGSGTIRCTSGNFPLGNSAPFADPIIGGTLEYYGAGGFEQTDDLLVNKLKIDLNSANSTITLAADLTTNGFFEVNRGTFIINDDASTIRQITSFDRVLVESQGKLIVSDDPGVRKHEWYFHDDLINNGGEIRFTNRTTANYTAYSSPETVDIVEAFFVSANQNQELRANGLSYFSRIIMDKGIDQTYTLSISSNNSNHFKLLGPCNDGHPNSSYINEAGNQNSFAMINGTAEIKENIFIPLQINSGNYNINNTVQLWVNGGEVTKGPLGGGGSSEAIVPYGTVKVTSGVLNALCRSGLTTRDNGLVQVDGGEINTNQIRTSVLGAENIGGLIINDGTVNIDGTLPGGTQPNFYTLSLTYPGNLFRMTGGVLNITGPSSSGLVFINSDPQNTSVTGGTMNLNISNTSDNHMITSRAAFWNLTLIRSSTSGTNRNFKVAAGDSGPGGVDNEELPLQDLVIKNNLSITGPNSPKLQMGIAGDPADLYIDGNLTIGSGCEYIHNDNTTYFVGRPNSSLTFGGSTTFPFGNVVVDKDLDSRSVSIQPTGPTSSMDILGNFSIERGSFENANRNVIVRGNVRIKSRFGNFTSGGRLFLQGITGRQRIFSEGGSISTMFIVNPDGVELVNDRLTILQRIFFSSGSLFIGDQTLRIQSTNSSYLQSFNSTDKFIVCSGNPSAGGLEILNYEPAQNIVFPVGVSTGNGIKYTPTNIYINSNWVDTGYVRVTPVDTLLTSSDLDGAEDYLNFHWKVSHSEYSSVPNVTHRFIYQQDDVRGTDESTFESGRVLSTLPFTRTLDNAPASPHVNTSSNQIFYNGSDVAQSTTGSGTPLVNADYSAGAADRFPIGSSPDVFFSRSATVGAAWDNPANWNKLQDCPACVDVYSNHSSSQPATLEYPESGDIAVIGFNVDNGSMKPHVYAPPAGGIEAAQVVFTPLQDVSGNSQPRYNGPSSVDLGILRPSLEIVNTSDIIRVGQITGEGALILKDNIDLGVTDLGGFLAEDSSVVVIDESSGAPFKLDFISASLPNLFIATGEPSITADLTIRGNLEIAGTSKLILNESDDGDVFVDGDLILDKYQLAAGNPTIYFNKDGSSKSITIGGDLKLLGSTAYIGFSPEVSGPSDPPEPWTPDEISPFIWFDATEGVTSTGGFVSAWQNQGMGAYTATQSDNLKRPSVQVGLNGINTLRFDGVDDFLEIPHSNEFNIAASEDFEIFSVAQFNDPVALTEPDFSVMFAKGKTSDREFMFYLAIRKYRLYMDRGRMRVEAPNNHTTAPNLGWARRQGNNAKLFNTVGGNASRGNVGNGRMDGNTHNVTIGAAEDGTIRFMDGDIGEIIMFKRALTSNERQRVEGWLAHKWGLQNELPVGHPYRTIPPFIGVETDETSRLIVEGDIVQDLTNASSMNNGIELYDIDAEASFVNLVVREDGNNQFDNRGGPAPRLWKVQVDKGIDIASSFTFNSDVEIDGPANELEKPIDLKNGLLVLNDPNINITLSSGGGDFTIPITAGLELNGGNLDLVGNETGLLLSGLLKITGGSLNIGNTEGVNNYIEYGGGGAPKIEISGGTLTVGSQIRRNLASTGGSLNYRQSGGDVVIGRYSAPEANRGMLEITNSGSRFEHTDGTLTFVRGVNINTTPSLLIQPDFFDVGGNSEIVIGSADSPPGAAISNFGIESSIALNNLTIASTNSPVANLISTDLEIGGDLTIGTGASLVCNQRDLTLDGDVINNGLLTSTEGTVIINHPVFGTISGSGTFDLNDLVRSGDTGQTLVQTSLLVNNDFTNGAGEMVFGTNTLTVRGNVTHDGLLSFDSPCNGLIFNGDEEQIFSRSGSGASQIDIMTINNGSGITIPAGFSEFLIGKNLRMQRGVFSLTGNLLEMAEGATFTPVNSFGESNMIVTGGAFSNFGLKLNIPANSTDDIFVPLGIDRYMPINLNFSAPGYSSGTTASSYLLRLNIPECGVVIQDVEPVPPQINDLNNVLGMFFSIDGTNVGDGLNVDVKLQYDQQYVQVTTPYTEVDYIAARVLADNTTISKLGPDAVDEVNDILTFNLQGDFAGNQFAVDGDYFAGVDPAVPNTILVYETIMAVGDVNDGNNAYDQVVPGGGSPTGAKVIVKSGDRLNFNVDGVNFYQTEIESGATVVIEQTSLHRLGRVSGTGTIEVQGSATLPAGDYSDFFGCGGGRLAFQSVFGQSFEILANMPPLEGLTLRGPGELTIAENDIDICSEIFITGNAQVKTANSSLLDVSGDVTIENGDLEFRQGNVLINGNLDISADPFFPAFFSGRVGSGNDGVLTVKGDLLIGGRGMSIGTVFRETHVEGDITKNSDPAGGSIQDGTGGAKLILNGFSPQTINGDFIGNSLIPTFELDNASGLTLAGDVEVSENLLLTSGNIFTDIDNLVRLTEDATQVTPEGGQPTSFVDGPMQWDLSSGANKVKFPIGNNDRYRPLSISERSIANTWEAQYVDTIARIVPIIDALMLPDPLSIPIIETVSVQEFWRVETSGGTTTANIELSWGDSSAVSTNTAEQSNLVVLAYDEVDDHWDSYGGTDFTYNAPTNRGTVNSIDPITFSERYFTLGSADEVNPLPVTWLYFRGENKGQNHKLFWATATEIYNDYFELERSFDGQNWIVVTRLTAAGESNTKQEYSYTDQDVPIGVAYYRLKQVDFDGKQEFSPSIVGLERVLSVDENTFDFFLYPNPTELGSFQIKLANVTNATAFITLTDLSGKVLDQSYEQIDGQGISAPFECHFGAGAYWVTVIVNDKVRSRLLIVSM